MTPKAAEELLEVIMSDDYVERRRKLDIWSQRWISTAECKFMVGFDKDYNPSHDQNLHKFAKEKLAEMLVDGILEDTERLRFAMTDLCTFPKSREYSLLLFVLRQEPYHEPESTPPLH